MWKPFFFLSFLEDSLSSVFSADTYNANATTTVVEHIEVKMMGLKNGQKI